VTISEHLRRQVIIELRDDACDLETEARILVETAIEKGAG